MTGGREKMACGSVALSPARKGNCKVPAPWVSAGSEAASSSRVAQPLLLLWRDQAGVLSVPPPPPRLPHEDCVGAGFGWLHGGRGTARSVPPCLLLDAPLQSDDTRAGQGIRGLTVKEMLCRMLVLQKGLGLRTQVPGTPPPPQLTPCAE